MLTRTLALALFVLTLCAAGAHAQEDAAASPAPAAEASAAPAPADAAAPASPAEASPAAAASPAPAGEATLLGTYAYDIDYVLEQQADYQKFSPEQKKAAHDKATADAPKLEIVFSPDRLKISENGTVKTDASYKIVKKAGPVFTVELTDALAKEKKTDVVNFDLQGTRLKMSKEGDKETLVWVKTK